MSLPAQKDNEPYQSPPYFRGDMIAHMLACGFGWNASQHGHMLSMTNVRGHAIIVSDS